LAKELVGKITAIRSDIKTLTRRRPNASLLQTRVPNPQAATSSLDVLNSKHPSFNFTMETAMDNTLPFLGMNIAKNSTILSTSVYRKPTNTGLYLNYDSHVDHRYKAGLLKTILKLKHCLKI